jgi:hypothetical protein
MGIVRNLSALAVGPLLRGLRGAPGIPMLADSAEAIAGFLTERFTDQSQRLTAALQTANNLCIDVENDYFSPELIHGFTALP